MIPRNPNVAQNAETSDSAATLPAPYKLIGSAGPRFSWVTVVRKSFCPSSGTVYGDAARPSPTKISAPRCRSVCMAQAKSPPNHSSPRSAPHSDCAESFLRFGNIVGDRTTHGAFYDFIRQLAKNSAELKVLGNGLQSKPYIYVRDIVDAIVFAGKKCAQLEAGRFDVFNVAPDGGTTVKFMAEELVLQLGFKDRTKISYGTTAGGWPGDVPHSRMDASSKSARPGSFCRALPTKPWPRHQPHHRMAAATQKCGRRFALAAGCEAKQITIVKRNGAKTRTNG